LAIEYPSILLGLDYPDFITCGSTSAPLSRSRVSRILRSKPLGKEHRI
jgi:hypothetical protein